MKLRRGSHGRRHSSAYNALPPAVTGTQLFSALSITALPTGALGESAISSEDSFQAEVGGLYCL